MPNVYSQFDRTPRAVTPTGSIYLDEYQEEINDGVRSLTKTGAKNTDELIQLDLESSKIQNILAKALNGDFSDLKAREGTYVDATTMPKNLMDAQNLVIRMKSEFEKMPTEIKNQFNNSADKYVELMGTKEFSDIMAPYNEQIAKISMEKSHKEYLKKVEDGAQLNYDIAKRQKEIETMAGGKDA